LKDPVKGTVYFEIPGNVEVMAKLVLSVPQNWASVSGRLLAPLALIAEERAEKNTGFSLGRYHDINPTIVGAHDSRNGEEVHPNLFALMVDQKLPGFVNFAEVGLYSEFPTVADAQRIAAGFLRKGYRGGLWFCKSYHDNSSHAISAECHIKFQPWREEFGLSDEFGSQPARIRLDWKSRYSGKEEDIAPIVSVCRALGLREYTPVKANASVVVAA